MQTPWIADALDFYKKQAGPLVAGRFLEEFERVADLLVEHPDLGMPMTRRQRAFPMKIFPYSVVYRHLETHIQILIVRHHHRKPGYAGKRREICHVPFNDIQLSNSICWKMGHFPFLGEPNGKGKQ